MNDAGCDQSIYKEQLRKHTKNCSLLYFTQGFDIFPFQKTNILLCNLSNNIKLLKLLKAGVHAECSLHKTFSLAF